jgi:prepilin-type N-terminal cleavage/methylation domain-containing protein
MHESQPIAPKRQPLTAGRQLPSSAFGLRPSRSAFTLTELLIVIAIIAILAGLIAAAAINALRRGREAGIQLEIRNLSAAVEEFKTDRGVYPPNAMNPGTPAIAKLVQSDMQRTFAKAFQGSKEPAVLALALCGQNTAGGTNENLPNGMTAAEAVYFWLGGFSSDKNFPISGPGGPSFPVTGPDANVEVLENRTGGYEFDLGRLGPRTDAGVFDASTNRFIVYEVDLNADGDVTDPGERRRINFWHVTPRGSEQPLVYFDTSRHKPYQYDPYAGPTVANVFPIKKVREGAAAASTMRDIAFIDDKYQILHCGLDDDWGSFGVSASSTNDPKAPLLFPEGPFIGPTADTLTNFTDGTLADASEE